SGGERQRVAIARALVKRPEILLADEPTGNLDSKSGAEVVALLHQLASEGSTLVLITHDANIAASFPRQIHMRDGEIVGDERISARPLRPCRDATASMPRGWRHASSSTSRSWGCGRGGCAPPCRRSVSRSGSGRWWPSSACRPRARRTCWRRSTSSG